MDRFMERVLKQEKEHMKKHEGHKAVVFESDDLQEVRRKIWLAIREGDEQDC